MRNNVHYLNEIENFVSFGKVEPGNKSALV